MKARTRKALSGTKLSGTNGITLVEVLIALVVVAIIGIGAGSLYVSAQNALDLSSAESFVQRQGTLIEEEMIRQVSRANSLQVAVCRPSGVVLASGPKSIIYNRRVQNASTSLMEDQTWCIFEHPGPPIQLQRCRIPALTPPQSCSNPAENLLYGIPDKSGRFVRASNTSFALATILCGTVPCATVTTMDVRFTLELARAASGAASLLTAPREFGFNLSIRN